MKNVNWHCRRAAPKGGRGPHQQHLSRITRNGQLEVTNDHGEMTMGTDARNLCFLWYRHGPRKDAAHLVNYLFSTMTFAVGSVAKNTR